MNDPDLNIMKNLIQRCINKGCSQARILFINTNTTRIVYENKNFIKEHLIEKKVNLKVIYNNNFGELDFSFNKLNSIDSIVDSIIKISTSGLNNFYKNIFDFYPDKIKISKFNKLEYLDGSNMLIWIKDQISKIEMSLKCNILYFLYIMKNMTTTFIDSENNFFQYISIHKPLNMILEKNMKIINFGNDNIPVGYNLYENLKKLYFNNPNKKFNISNPIDLNNLESIIRFSHDASAQIISLIIPLFNGRNILNNRSYLKKEMLSKKIFKDTISLYDDPTNLNGQVYFPFDGDGIKCTKKFLIKDGVINDFLNNFEIYSLMDGTSPGNYHLSIYDNTMDILPSNVTLIINEDRVENFDIYIEKILFSKSNFNILTGKFDCFAQGYKYKGNESQLFKFSININDFISNIKPSSQYKWVGIFNIPEISINFSSIGGSHDNL